MSAKARKQSRSVSTVSNGKAVAAAVASNRDLAELSLEELRGFADVVDAEVYQVLTLEGSVAARDHLGGTAPTRVREAAALARRALEAARSGDA